MEPLVSIIIPVYNGEETLSRTLKSVLNQSYAKIEIIIVNDCSTDSTALIIDGFFKNNETNKRIKAFNHNRNMGVSEARNTGLKYVLGKYIYFVDSDDWIDPNTIKLLVQKAVFSNSQIVGCNWFLSFEGNERKMKQPKFSSPEEAIEKVLYGSLRWNLWLYLVSYELYKENEIEFFSNMNIGEDLLVMIKLFKKATRVSSVEQHLYHYNQENANSLTKTNMGKHLDQITFNVLEVEKELKDDLQWGKMINFLKLHIKLPLLISLNIENYKVWKSWFPESNSYIFKNNEQPLRTKILQWFAYKEQFWLIKLYNRVFIGFIYKILYR